MIHYNQIKISKLLKFLHHTWNCFYHKNKKYLQLLTLHIVSEDGFCSHVTQLGSLAKKKKKKMHHKTFLITRDQTRKDNFNIALHPITTKYIFSSKLKRLK